MSDENSVVSVAEAVQPQAPKKNKHAVWSIVIAVVVTAVAVGVPILRNQLVENEKKAALEVVSTFLKAGKIEFTAALPGKEDSLKNDMRNFYYAAKTGWQVTSSKFKTDKMTYFFKKDSSEITVVLEKQNGKWYFSEISGAPDFFGVVQMLRKFKNAEHTMAAFAVVVKSKREDDAAFSLRNCLRSGDYKNKKMEYNGSDMSVRFSNGSRDITVIARKVNGKWMIADIRNAPGLFD